MILITQAVSIRTIRNLLMERVAKRHLTDLVVGVSLRHQQVAEDYLTATAQATNRLVAVVIYKRNKRHQRVFNVQTNHKSVHLEQIDGLWV